jgi:hypothetical protein
MGVEIASPFCQFGDLVIEGFGAHEMVFLTLLDIESDATST